MSPRFSNFFNELFELFPEWWVTPGSRRTTPVVGTRYRVRRRVIVRVVMLPLTPSAREFEISLPPTTAILIHAATRPDADNVYAQFELPGRVELLPPAEREAARTGGYLLEIERSALQSHFMRG